MTMSADASSAVADWAGSGLAFLTGAPDGPPDFSCAAVLSEARRVAAEVTRLLGVDVDAATLLAGRAALLGLSRRGRISAGGATRLLATIDNWCAVALPRADDVTAVPALLRSDTEAADPWSALAAWAATQSAQDVVSRAQLLDIAAAVLAETAPGEPVIQRHGVPAQPRRPGELLVADLSSIMGRPAVRATARASRRGCRQSGKPGPPGRHPLGCTGFLQLDERGKTQFRSAIRR